jgi:hypothetical protein
MKALLLMNPKGFRHYTWKFTCIAHYYMGRNSAYYGKMDLCHRRCQIQVAEFAKAQTLQEHVTFRWWVQKLMQKRTDMIKAIKTQHVTRSHIYGKKLLSSLRKIL